MYADIEAAWHCLRTRYGISPENIILYGQSIGTVPTGMAAIYVYIFTFIYIIYVFILMYVKIQLILLRNMKLVL